MQNKKSKTRQLDEALNSESDIATRLVHMQKHMLNFAFSLTHDYEDAEDLVMQVNEKILSSPEKFKHDTNFKSWVILIIKNDFINSYRRDKIRSEHAYNCDPYQLPDDCIPRTAQADSEMIFSQLMSIVKSIPNYELLLGFMNGYTYDQLADITELPIGTIKSRIFLARKQFRTFMKSLKG